MSDMENQELTPQRACDIAACLYRQTPVVEQFWSRVNNVYLLRFPNGLPQRVMKGAKSDPAEILREQKVIPALAGHGLTVPPIELTQADFSSTCPAFTIMPRIGQRNLGERYHAGDNRPVMRAMFHEIGSLLARLHTIPMHYVPGCLPEEAGRQRIRRQRSAMLSRIRQNHLGIDRISKALDALGKWLEDDPVCFTHGDCHPHNVVLADDERLVTIDWGNAGAGFAWSDLGRCLAITSLFFGDWQWIREGYLANQTVSPEMDLKITTWMCMMLLEAGWDSIKDRNSPKARQIMEQVQMELPPTFE